MIVVVLPVVQEINKELQRKNSKKKKTKNKRTNCLTKRNLINVMMKTGARCTWPPKLRLFFQNQVGIIHERLLEVSIEF